MSLPFNDKYKQKMISITNSLKCYSADELLDFPSPEYLILDHIPKSGLTLLYGDIGKSFLTLDMGLSLATGEKYLSHFPLTQSKVLYLCKEDMDCIGMRVNAWCIHRKFTVKPSDNFYGTNHNYNFLKEDDIKSIFNQTKFIPDLIIVDYFHRYFGGIERMGDKNNTKDMNDFISNCRLLNKCGSAVLVIDYSNMNESREYQGSLDLFAACDQVITVEKMNEENIKVNCEKNKHDAEFESYYVKKNIIKFEGKDEYGEEYTSLALSYMPK